MSITLRKTTLPHDILKALLWWLSSNVRIESAEETRKTVPSCERIAV